MAKIELRNIEAHTVKGKLDIDTVADYESTVLPGVVFTVRHFLAGEHGSFLRVRQDGSASYDSRAIFADRVTAVKGLTVEFGNGEKEITKVADFLALPDTPDHVLSEMIQEVTLFLVTGRSLSGDEEKN